MKRILVLNYEYPPLGGGGGVASRCLAEGFVRAGFDVDVVTTGFRGLPAMELVNGVRVHRVAVPGRTEQPTASLRSLIAFPFCAYFTARKLCRTYEYAWINTHFAVPTGPLGVWIARAARIPLVLSVHGGDIYDPSKKTSPHRSRILRAVVNWVLRNAHEVVAQSSDTKRNVERFYRPKKDVRIIPLPYEPITVQPLSRTELGLQEDAVYLVSIGRFVKRKGFDFLLRGLAQVNDPRVRALIVGAGPEWDALHRLAEELGIAERVVFTGAVSQERKFQLLQAADIYVLSSMHEGFGICLQEAMQAGLPIISTNHGGQVDLVAEEERGLLVTYGDTDALARAIERLKKDPQLSARLSSNNQRAIAAYAVHAIVQRHLELL